MAIATNWLDAQIGVLGSMLISPETVPLVLSRLSDRDFSGKNLLVFQAIRAVFNSGAPVDVITVRDKLGANATDYLMQLMEVTPTAKNIEAYIDRCRKQAQLSTLQVLGTKLSACNDLNDAKTLIAQINDVMVETTSADVVDMDTALRDYFERHCGQRTPNYTHWPIREMDERIFSEPGNFDILAGYPSDGKSAFALQCAWLWAEKKRVGFFSFETSWRRIFDRQMAASTGAALRDIKNNRLPESYYTEVSKSSASIVYRQLEIIQAAGMTVSDICARALARRYDTIIVDYIQIVTPANAKANDYEKVTQISMDLHRLAQSTGIHVLALSQFSRPQSGQKAKEPRLSDLRQSGQLEQDADVALLLYRPDESKQQRVLHCAKNKEGELFKVLLNFDGDHQTFSKASDPGAVNAAMRRMAKERKMEEQKDQQQFSLLPSDTPVPFEEGESK